MTHPPDWRDGALGLLDRPCGIVLLLGAGGCGRQSLAQLSAYPCDAGGLRVEVAMGYALTEFKCDLRKCLVKCCVEDKVRFFPYCDTQAAREDLVMASLLPRMADGGPVLDGHTA